MTRFGPFKILLNKDNEVIIDEVVEILNNDRREVQPVKQYTKTELEKFAKSRNMRVAQ